MPTPDWDVVVVGGINSDYLVRGRDLPRRGMSLNGSVFLDAPGGKGANAAVAAVRLDARTALIGCVGNDERGRDHIASLKHEGVDVAHVAVRDRSPTGAAVIQVDERGQKQILAALGANLALSVDEVRAAGDMIRSTRTLLMQLEVPIDCVVEAARLGHHAGVRIVLDPAPPRPLPDELLARVEVIRANETEIEALTGIHVHDVGSAGNGARALLGRGVKAVIAQAGSGNLVVWHSGEEWIPELPVDSVDATGAGDAFSAALAVALTEGQPLPEAGRFASGAAALSTTVLGAQAGLPRRSNLDAYLNAVAKQPR